MLAFLCSHAFPVSWAGGGKGEDTKAEVCVGGWGGHAVVTAKTQVLYLQPRTHSVSTLGP